MKKKSLVLISFASLLLMSFVFVPTGSIYISGNGIVKFISNAPLETITAESKKMSGVLDAEKRTFAFSVPIPSFEGFNSPLQKEHFNENYLESDKIPKAFFKGKIIEEVNIELPGTYTVRVKGAMQIHDIEKELIIKAKIISSTGGKITISSSFNVLLKDFNINIPTIVNQKIASEILVDVKTDMSLKK